MALGRLIGVLIAALSMFGGVAIVIGRTPLPATNIGQIEKCVADQFAENGFMVSASSATRFEGRVTGKQPAGPAIAMVFNADNTGSLYFQSSSLQLPIARNQLGAVQNLADHVTARCLQAERDLD